MDEMDINHLIHSSLYTSLNDTLRILVPDWLRPIIGIFIGSLAIWLSTHIRTIFRTLADIIKAIVLRYQKQPNQIHLEIQMKTGKEPVNRATKYSIDLMEWITANHANSITEFMTMNSYMIPINLRNFTIEPELDIRIDVNYNQLERDDANESVTYTKVTIRVYSWVASSRDIKSFLERCNLEIQILHNLDPKKTTFMHLDEHGTHFRNQQSYSANFDNLTMRLEDRIRLMTYLDHFADKERLRHLSLPDRAFIMLYGPPGTGKTSMIKAMAQHTKRILVRLSIRPDTTSGDFRDMFYTYFNQYGFDKVIYVLEEIDTVHSAFLKRQTDKTDISQEHMTTLMNHIKSLKNDDDTPPSDTNNLKITDILEAFDGLCETPGLMLIATTNHIEELDPAIVRRFGLRLHLGLLCRETFSNIINRHYNKYVSDTEWDQISDNIERMSPNNLIDICTQNDKYEDLIKHIAGLELGEAKSLVESEQSK